MELQVVELEDSLLFDNRDREQGGGGIGCCCCCCCCGDTVQ
jgi:hypothetical protein